MLFAMYGVTDHWELKIRSIKFAVNLSGKKTAFVSYDDDHNSVDIIFVLHLYFHYDIQSTSPHWINWLHEYAVCLSYAPLVLWQTVVVVTDVFSSFFFVCFNSRLHHLNFVWVHLEVLLSSIAIKINKMTACIMYRLRNEIEWKNRGCDRGERNSRSKIKWNGLLSTILICFSFSSTYFFFVQSQNELEIKCNNKMPWCLLWAYKA